MGNDLVPFQEITPATSTVDAERLLVMFFKAKSEHTKRSYKQDLGRLAAFLGVETNAEAAGRLLSGGQGAANMMALQFSNHLVEQGLSPATINRALTSLSSVVKIGRLVGAVGWRLDVTRIESKAYRDTLGPGREAINKLLALLDESPRGLRNRAIIRLLYNRGLRRGEVAGLNIEHFDPKRRTEGKNHVGAVYVLGKKRKEREWFTLPVSSTKTIIAWLAVHPFRKTPSAPLFVSLDTTHENGPLTGKGIYYIISSLGARAGFKVWPHGLRHSGITDVLERSGGDMRKAQVFSRHKSADTLLIYDDNRKDVGKEMADLLEDDE